MEVDFNALNKIIFKSRVIPTLEKKWTILDEIIRERRCQSAIDTALNNKLISDIANQQKVPTILILTDATNCYNRIVHLIVDLLYQSY